ncbi:MAG: aminotransferase class I/II-fold pyridoxal phosphate-dependent enzyme [Actinomycetota bacterium]
MSWRAWAETATGAIRAAGRWRIPRAVGPEGPVVFASNDYLGLTRHPAVIAAAHAALDRWGAGSGSARLIVGSRGVHHELEAELAEWRRMPRAAIFPTGFAANLGVLTTVGTHGTLICSDELNHASIIDGCRLARAETRIYRHGDLDHLDAILGDRGDRRAVVVSDTVFSMDGDRADVGSLIDLCARHDALLVLDEAHAVLGPDVDPGEAPVLRVGTLSKTLGALGGFVAGPTAFIELLENAARPYIFTTAPTPADTAAALAALRVLRSPEGGALTARLRELVERVRPGHPSPIIPFVVGDEEAALFASAALAARGLLVPAIRPPTVAPGTSRLRVTLSAAHTDPEVDALVVALADIHGSLTR